MLPIHSVLHGSAVLIQLKLNEHCMMYHFKSSGHCLARLPSALLGP